VLIAVASLPAVASHADAGRRIAVVSMGSCPNRDVLATALAQAMPDAAIVSSADIPGDAEPVVVMSDDGEAYRVVVRRIVRTMFDGPARCEERARKVAIVAALALEPPDIPSEVTEVAPAIQAAAPPRSDLLVHVEAGGMAEHGVHTRVSPVGGTVRLTIGHPDLAVAIGGSLAPWSNFDDYGSYVQRIPLDVSMQLRRRFGSFAAGIELGPSLVFQRAKAGGDRRLELEADIRMSGRVEWWFGGTYGAFTALTSTYVPSPAPPFAMDYTLASWWLGASAGLVLQVR
jgi:hypothetical protein